MANAIINNASFASNFENENSVTVKCHSDAALAVNDSVSISPKMALNKLTLLSRSDMTNTNIWSRPKNTAWCVTNKYIIYASSSGHFEFYRESNGSLVHGQSSESIWDLLSWNAEDFDFAPVDDNHVFALYNDTEAEEYNGALLEITDSNITVKDTIRISSYSPDSNGDYERFLVNPMSAQYVLVTMYDRVYTSSGYRCDSEIKRYRISNNTIYSDVSGTIDNRTANTVKSVSSNPCYMVPYNTSTVYLVPAVIPVSYSSETHAYKIVCSSSGITVTEMSIPSNVGVGFAAKLPDNSRYIFSADFNADTSISAKISSSSISQDMIFPKMGSDNDFVFSTAFPDIGIVMYGNNKCCAFMDYESKKHIGISYNFAFTRANFSFSITRPFKNRWLVSEDLNYLCVADMMNVTLNDSAPGFISGIVKEDLGNGYYNVLF